MGRWFGFNHCPAGALTPTCPPVHPPSDDKQISKEECAAAGHSAEKVEEVFANVDADKDGQLTKEELAEAIAKDTKDAAKTTAATAQVAALDTDGDKTKVTRQTSCYSVTQLLSFHSGFCLCH